MIVFNIVVWSFVSAALAWWKSSEGLKVWPDVLASVSAAAAVVIMYLVGLAS